MVIGIESLGWGLLIGIAIYGFRSGAARILCLALMVMLASVLSMLFAPLFAILAPMSDASLQPAVIGICRAGLFLVFLLLFFPFASVFSRVITFSFEPYESVVGLALGLALGLFVSSTFLSGAAAGADLMVQGGDINHLYIVRQLVFMDGWHSFTGYLGSLGDNRPTFSYPEAGQPNTPP